MTFPFSRATQALGLIVGLCICLGGCATADMKSSDKSAYKVDKAESATFKNVIRYGRYTLIEITPSESQRDLMTQIIDVTIPLSQSAGDVTVADAMRYVLQRSGYRLRIIPPVFDELPLPVAHNHLGPTMLRDALNTLAGPAWILQVNESTREISFVSAIQGDDPRMEKVEEAK